MGTLFTINLEYNQVVDRICYLKYVYNITTKNTFKVNNCLILIMLFVNILNLRLMTNDIYRYVVMVKIINIDYDN